jgi:glycosyltransferase involved in cell wall biosynthesis
LRFCFLTTFYPPFNFGGDGIGVQRLAQGLAKRGHDVTVVHDADAYTVLGTGEPPQAASPDPFGVRVITLQTRAALLNTLLTQQTGRPILNAGRLREILAAGSFHVINFNNISLIGGPGLLRYGTGALKVYLAHEHWLVCPTHVLWRHGRELCVGRECFRCQLHYKRPPQLWRYTGYLESQLDNVDVFIAMSEFSRAKHREFGFPREMTVLPNFLPDPDESATDAIGPRPHERAYFLFVGRLERIKGLDDVLDAFVHYRDADLLVIGDGDYAEALRSKAADNPRVRFVGRLSPEQLPQYYRHALAVLAPSICFETFGLTLIEAFSHGIPVIARRLGPFPEIIEKSNGGELFDTAEDLIKSMERLQADPNRRRQLGAAGYEAFLAHWSESAVIPRYLQIVEDARAQRSRRRAPTGVASDAD